MRNCQTMMPPNALLAYARAVQIALLMFVQTFAWAGQTPQARPEAPTVGFTLLNIDQEWWLVAPDGQPLFSLGVRCVHQGLVRDQFDPVAPAYAALQHYDN